MDGAGQVATVFKVNLGVVGDFDQVVSVLSTLMRVSSRMAGGMWKKADMHSVSRSSAAEENREIRQELNEVVKPIIIFKGGEVIACLYSDQNYLG